MWTLVDTCTTLLIVLIMANCSSMKKLLKKNTKEVKEVKEGVPETLLELGYKFNENRNLRSIKTGEAYEFNFCADRAENQRRYESLGEIITQHIYTLLETQTGLHTISLPVDASKEESQGFIYASDDALSNPDKLLVLIHGSGVVRAGQWSRRLIINDSLDTGTMLPFIERAISQGYGILILNCNQNERPNKKGVVKPIRNSEDPEAHTMYVWENIVSKAPARHIAVIAHSYGGYVSVETAKLLPSFRDRVFALCLTDSVHSTDMQQVPTDARKWLSKHAVNWLTFESEADSLLPVTVITPDHEMQRRSAGTMNHDLAPSSAFEHIFKHLAVEYEKLSPSSSMEESSMDESAEDEPKTEL